MKGKLRSKLKEDRGLIIPDEWVISDTDDYFSYQKPDGPIVGWNRNVEIWWRNVDRKETHT